jgi:CheY-like chemotaxis protein
MTPASTKGATSAVQTDELLYIEDHLASVQVMEAVVDLRPQWTMVHAGQVSSGVELARARHPQLILLDMHLPDGSGSDALAALKQDAATVTIPVVILTAGVVADVAPGLLAAGAAACWSKPFDLEQLLNLLDSLATRN